MKRQFILPALSILLFASLACNALSRQAAPEIIPTSRPQTQNSGIPQTEDEVPRIPVGEAKAALDSGQAILVDVRSSETYAANHAVGAILIPLDVFENNILSIPLEKGQWIITYCT